jgi:CheY-like chemotaxis protein
MVRPCFLVIDREYAGSISTRKLVIETAKFNVLTAYSADEAIEILQKFPALDGIVMDAEMPDMPCTQLIRSLKHYAPAMPVIAVGMPRSEVCDGADHHLESFDPRRLLALLEKLRPEDTAAIERRNETLKARE